MTQIHQVQNISFKGNIFILVVDNQKLELSLQEVSQKLANASDVLRNDYQILPSGYGIHWPGLDEDLSIDGLMRQFTSKSTINKT